MWCHTGRIFECKGVFGPWESSKVPTHHSLLPFSYTNIQLLLHCQSVPWLLLSLWLPVQLPTDKLGNKKGNLTCLHFALRHQWVHMNYFYSCPDVGSPTHVTSNSIYDLLSTFGIMKKSILNRKLRVLGSVLHV